ncbi:hypothetical protein GGQ95_002843 [Anoxybacillus rupiensis]|nr:hypothetical protein [Anoxybacillus rupiensis]
MVVHITCDVEFGRTYEGCNRQQHASIWSNEVERGGGV